MRRIYAVVLASLCLSQTLAQTENASPIMSLDDLTWMIGTWKSTEKVKGEYIFVRWYRDLGETALIGDVTNSRDSKNREMLWVVTSRPDGNGLDVTNYSADRMLSLRPSKQGDKHLWVGTALRPNGMKVQAIKELIKDSDDQHSVQFYFVNPNGKRVPFGPKTVMVRVDE